jgi:hypothetical protein
MNIFSIKYNYGHWNITIFTPSVFNYKRFSVGFLGNFVGIDGCLKYYWDVGSGCFIIILDRFFF